MIFLSGVMIIFGLGMLITVGSDRDSNGLGGFLLKLVFGLIFLFGLSLRIDKMIDDRIDDIRIVETSVTQR